MSRLRHDDAGNAMVEFCYLAVLLMVPLVYLLVTVFRVQGAAYAASSAVREAGRVFVAGDRPARGGQGDLPSEERAFRAARLVMSDSGLVLRPEELLITCAADPCLTPGSSVEVEIDVAVPLPVLPDFLSGGRPASVRVSSNHVEVVDGYRVTR